MSWHIIYLNTDKALEKAKASIIDIGTTTTSRNDGLGNVICYSHSPSHSIYINTNHPKFLKKLHKKFNVDFCKTPLKFNEEDWFWRVL